MKRYNGKCRGCGTARSVMAERQRNSKRTTHGWTSVFLTDAGEELYGASHDQSVISVRCAVCPETEYHPSGRYLVLKPVHGKFNAKKTCNARCESATGHTCECSCGGKNHGAAHG